MAGPAPDDKRPHDERRDATRSPVENVLERSLVDDSGLGRPLSRRAATTQRTVEAYAVLVDLVPRPVRDRAAIVRQRLLGSMDEAPHDRRQ